MFLVLVWRNIWRNRRRTLITSAMVMLAAFLSITMHSVQMGVYDRNIDNLVTFTTGYVQVNAAGHREEKTLETSVEFTPQLREKILAYEGVTGILPRINWITLAAGDSLAREGLIMASDPVEEDKLVHLSERIDTGRYLKPGDDGVVLAAGLAKRLKVNLGDTIVLLGAGFHAQSANGLFPVVGITSIASPKLNKLLIYMTFEKANELLSLEGRATNLVLQLDDHSQSREIAAGLQKELGDEYEVPDWHQLAPELSQMAAGEYASGMIFMAILYIIIAFGVFGTILMMLSERKYEFGVVTALGMKRWLLSRIVVFETLIIAALGALAGMVLALPVVLYLHHYPISLAGDYKETYEKLGFEPLIQAGIYSEAFINNALAVLIITVLLSLYPVIHIMKLKPIENLRG